ncbi:hypothetical protein GPECTOR_607g688 [Gonium pectorale]|uniref:Uncharacterized protein n=1 Tax=Gonium pectorale TaxID=33097 RepID=A0A150FW41_GONPE|nr:hypothetical protein GPECTOR_607g688 [Gonium pectorale]|eukprot:KXZ41250.1 hypothetical protein GPECTOR_607g688 [Gonium pectorale]
MLSARQLVDIVQGALDVRISSQLARTVLKDEGLTRKKARRSPGLGWTRKPPPPLPKKRSSASGDRAPKRPRKAVAAAAVQEESPGTQGAPAVSQPQLSAEQRAVVEECREVMGLAAGESVSDRWLKDEANLLAKLRFFVLVNRLLAARGARLFDLLPVCCKVKSHFVTLDTSCMYGVAKDAGLLRDDCRGSDFQVHADAHWASLLGHLRLRPKGGRFTGTIETDGVAVCIHYLQPCRHHDDDRGGRSRSRRVGQCCERPSQEDITGSRVLAVNLGRTNIAYVVELLDDGRLRVYRLTRAGYYRESGILGAARRAQHWLKGVRRATQALSLVSSKGAGLEAFLVFVRVHLETSGQLWAEMLKHRWAQERLRLHGGKKRALALFLEGLVWAGEARGDRRPVLIAYGAAGFASGGKGELSVPTTRMYRAFTHRFLRLVYLVDEFRTTRVHHEDDSVLESVHKRKKGKVETSRRREQGGGVVGDGVDDIGAAASGAD